MGGDSSHGLTNWCRTVEAFVVRSKCDPLTSLAQRETRLQNGSDHGQHRNLGPCAPWRLATCAPPTGSLGQAVID